MQVENDLKTVSSFLKYLPRHMKIKSFPQADGENGKQAKETDTNASRSDLKERLRTKILELRQRTKKKNRDDSSNGKVLNKRIKKEKVQRPGKNPKPNRRDQEESNEERGRSRSKGNKDNKGFKGNKNQNGGSKSKGKRSEK